jgi:hypothetical protein
MGSPKIPAPHGSYFPTLVFASPHQIRLLTNYCSFLCFLDSVREHEPLYDCIPTTVLFLWFSSFRHADQTRERTRARRLHHEDGGIGNGGGQQSNVRSVYVQSTKSEFAPSRHCRPEGSTGLSQSRPQGQGIGHVGTNGNAGSLFPGKGLLCTILPAFFAHVM